jgi:glutaconate CoA-transferase subunit A
MPELKEKLMSLRDAAGLVRSGSTIAFGGMAIRDHPMGFIYELIRQGIGDLTILGWANGNDVDVLVGAGLVKRVDTSYVGLEAFGLAPNFRRAVERGEIEVKEYTEVTGVDRFRAGSMAIPFFPVMELFGSDIVKYNPDIREAICPITGERYHAIPAARPDIGVVHAPLADAHGNVLYGPTRVLYTDTDIRIAMAAKRTIVTVEQIVDHERVMRNANLNLIPRYRVEAVVEVPFGAHPCACNCLYDFDREHLREYAQAAKTPETFRTYLEKYIYGSKDHIDYLNRVGGTRRLLPLRHGRCA